MEASYVEIYQEKIRDLLRPGSAHSDSHAIQNAAPGGCPLVMGVQREPVTSVDSAAGLVRARSSDAIQSSLGDAESSLGDVESLLGDAESSLGDAKSSLGDVESLLGDA